MLRFAWLTDVHLNFVQQERIDALLDQVAALDPAGVFLTGDIAEAHDVADYLGQLNARLGLPIYFVLGNHDFYRGSIQAVRRQVTEFCADQPNLTYLTDGPIVPLTETTALIGHDGWADGRSGDYERSYVMLNDYKLIEELACFGKQERWPVLKALGDDAAATAATALREALADFPRVVMLTHVPPLRAACWHQGQISDDEWAPHFVCQAMGDALLPIMAEHPDQQLTILCGHTHGSGRTSPLPNVEVITGGAVYGHPEVQPIVEIL